MAGPMGWKSRQVAREVENYQARVAAERASQEAGTDRTPTRSGCGAPDIVPVLARRADGNGAGQRAAAWPGRCAGAATRLPRMSATTRVLRHPAHRRFVPSRQLPRRRPAVGGPAGDPRRLLLRGRPARDHGAAGPGGAAPPHPDRGRAAVRGRAGPRALHRVRPEPRARACRAGLGAELPDRLRRGQPDDPVQGQGGQGRRRRRPASACSPTRSCRPPTSCSTRPTRSRSARTSASTSS